jgi:hypothetical protein
MAAFPQAPIPLVEKLAVGPLTVTGIVLVLVHPFKSVALNTILCTPASVNDIVNFLVLSTKVAPPSNDHSNRTIFDGLLLDDKVMESPLQTIGLLTVKFATSLIGRTDTVSVDEQVPLLTVKKAL